MNRNYLILLVLCFLISCKVKRNSTPQVEQKIEKEKTESTAYKSHINDKWRSGYSHLDVWADFDSSYGFDLKGLEGADSSTVFILTIWGDEELDILIETLPKYPNIEALQVNNAKMDPKKIETMIAGLSEKPHFQKLILKNCAIKSIPSSIMGLTNLQTLDLSYNGITEFPPEIGNLKYLKFIRLYNNRSFLKFPEELGNLSKLEYLAFAGTRVKALPSSIGGCVKLKHLTGNACGLSGLPEEIGDCKELVYINLGYNKIERIPERIGELKKLDNFILGGNKIKEIPASVSGLEKMSFCDFSNNKLTEFPGVVLQNKKIFTLWLHGNSFKRIPKELAELPEIAHLMVDLDEIEPSDIQALRDAKPKLRIVSN